MSSVNVLYCYNVTTGIIAQYPRKIKNIERQFDNTKHINPNPTVKLNGTRFNSYYNNFYNTVTYYETDGQEPDWRNATL